MFVKPLADRLRPYSLDEFIGQEHLTGKSGPLRLAMEKKEIFSLILWGPPGCGKTTLARIIARETGSVLQELSAVSASVKDIREIVGEETTLFNSDRHTILFLDEIHRFNKAQQDRLLPVVETGLVTLIGATTENPSFGVISPLLSRCRVYKLKNLSEESLQKIIQWALTDKDRGLGRKNLKIDKKVVSVLINYSQGDARILLNALETASKVSSSNKITLGLLEKVLQERNLSYDKHGREHHNLISAFIKSLRGSDADASLYYLSRMIEVGEDPLFIARRMVIFASEDIGLANSNALLLANQVYQACRNIGLPECVLNLAHGAVYLATSPKSNSITVALQKSQDTVKKFGNLPVPLHLRNDSSAVDREMGCGRDYKYPHNYEGHYVSGEQYLPDKIKTQEYYSPTLQGQEAKIKEWAEKVKAKKRNNINSGKNKKLL